MGSYPDFWANIEKLCREARDNIREGKFVIGSARLDAAIASIDFSQRKGDNRALYETLRNLADIARRKVAAETDPTAVRGGGDWQSPQGGYAAQMEAQWKQNRAKLEEELTRHWNGRHFVDPEEWQDPDKPEIDDERPL